MDGPPQHCGDDGSHHFSTRAGYSPGEGGDWCSEGCGTWEELLPKFLKLLLKYFISKGAGGVDDASVVLLLYFLPLNLLFTICFFAFLIDELRPQLLCYSCRGR